MAEFKEAFKKVLAETFKEMTGKSTAEDPTTKEPTAEDLAEAIARQIDIKTSSQDATSIKGKVVDDSEIGDGKALVYSGVKDKIIYKRVGRGFIGGAVIEGGDMTKAVYDTNADNIVDNSSKLEGSTKAEVQDHAPKAHTLTSHSTKAHAELTGVGTDDHHAQAHTLASHSTKAHSELTGVGAHDHHRVEETASYIIFKVGSDYYAKNGQTGAIDYGGAGDAGGVDGAVASAVIQAAINALTVGRTWKEKVCLKGNMIVAGNGDGVTPLNTIPTNTEVEVQGSITRATNNPLLAVNEHQGANVSSVNIDIIGGILDGGAFASDMIQLYNLKHGLLSNIDLRNFNGNGVYMQGQATAAYKSFYNLLSNLKFGFFPSAAFTANKAFIYLDSYAIDNRILACIGSGVNVTSNYPDGIYVKGIAAAGGGGIIVLASHFDRVNHFLATDDAFKSGIRLSGHCVIDTCYSHGVLIGDKTQAIVIDGCEWVNQPANTDLINLVTTNYIEDLNVVNNICRQTTHRWCMNATDDTKIHRSNVFGNSWQAGTSGLYNEIPANYSVVPP
jgi:hypothetical protein